MFALLTFAVFWLGGPDVAVGEPVRRRELFEERIGFIADTQFESPSAALRRVGVFNWRWIDAQTDHFYAMRTPVQYETALGQLGWHFNELVVRHKVSMVLYLGDGANNGCAGELEQVLGVLASKADLHRVPVLFVLGNHDFLGAGNTWRTREREQLCEGDVVLSKLDAIEKISAFNRERVAAYAAWNRLDALVYVDSLEIARNSCEGNAKAKANAKRGNRRAAQHLVRGCYLAAVVSRLGAPGGIVLVDSNDYHDVLMRRYFTARRGAMSFRSAIRVDQSPSQHHWIEARVAELKRREGGGARHNFVVASHFPPWDFRDPRGLYFQRIGLLVDEITASKSEISSVAGRHYWVSAHTHTQVLDHRDFDLDGSAPIRSINIGSTVDWPSSSGYVQGVTRKYSPDVFAGHVTVPETSGGCEAVMQMAGALRSRDLVRESEYFSVGRIQRGEALLPVTLHFQCRRWDRGMQKRSLDNLRTFLGTIADENLRAHAARCLATRASYRDRHGPRISVRECREL